MTVPSATGRWRTAAATGLALGLLGAGLLLAGLAGRPPLLHELPVPAWALLALYVTAQQVTLGFPLRESSVLIALAQLPMALGVLLVDPLVHVGVLLLATLVDCLVRRRGPLKALVNLALAALEVGVASALLVLLRPPASPRAALWGALLVCLLVAVGVGHVCFDVVLRTLGLPRRSRRDLLEPLAVEAVTTTFFAALAALTVSAGLTDSSTLLVVLGLAVATGLAIRAYRRLAADQRATEELYAFVKALGPVDVEQPEALQVLQRVRELLHARSLELSVVDGQGGPGRCLRVHLGREPEVDERTLELPRSGPDLHAEQMTTPLVVAGQFVGLLSASRRVTNDRGFDMKDLRLLETVATELGAALDRGRLLRDLARAASTDPMTGLPNLHRMTGGLDELLASGRPLLLASVAVESFREVNDTLGHQVGDDLLREVARRLAAANPAALIGRTGGSRFAVALPLPGGGPTAGLFGLGLRTRVEGSAQLGAVGTHVRLSVGVVCAPEHGSDAPTLLRRAETAMYGARQAHGGPVVWEPAYEVQGQRRLAVVMALREALASGAVGVAFQPKVCSRTGAVTGVEALARWAHPALGSIDPEEFVPLAEAAGLMAPLTDTVLSQALAACLAWQQPGAPVGVSVNVSADTLQDASFVTVVADALRRGEVAPALLTLELTEDVVVADPQLAAERMHELQALGVSLSVDDFGTGYSSLTYLKGLPVDEVKIDKGFVAGLADDAGDQAVVRAVVDIAHTLGIRVVAEGVEDEAQHVLLRGLGVDEQQGFLHARPLPAAEVAAWLRSRAFTGPGRADGAARAGSARSIAS